MNQNMKVGQEPINENEAKETLEQLNAEFEVYTRNSDSLEEYEDMFFSLENDRIMFRLGKEYALMSDGAIENRLKELGFKFYSASMSSTNRYLIVSYKRSNE